VKIYEELKRRNVFRVGLAYLAVSWLIVQVAETVLPAFGIGSAAVRILVIILSVGFVLALVIAWSFELTTQGIMLERDVDRSRSITRTTGKKLDRIVILVLGIALSYFALDKFVFEPTRDANRIESARQQGRADIREERRKAASIAVLPFADLSPDRDHQYFSDGLAEELLDLLAKIEGLRVTSRTSSFSFAGKSTDIPGIAASLNVAYILEGSVRRSDDRLRVTVQLIDTGSDSHLWSQTYDRQMKDIFEMQDEIAAAVMESLRITMAGDIPLSTPTDPVAYSLFLQARHLWRQGSAEGVDKSYDMLRQVLDIDQQYSPAWDALSTVYTYQVGLGLVPFEEGYLKAREASERALEIDPDNAQALTSLGWDAMSLQNDLAAAAAYFHSARLSAPNNPMVLGNIATFAAVIGRLPEAVDLLNLAIEHDPIDSAKHTNLGAFYLAMGKLDEADLALAKALELSPEDVWTKQAMLLLRILQNRPEEALQTLENIDNENFQLTVLPMVLHDLGRVEETQAALAELGKALGTGVSQYDVAEVYAHLNLIDKAFGSLELAIRNAEDVSLIRTSVFLNKLSGDPRWAEILVRLGLADEQVSDIEL